MCLDYEWRKAIKVGDIIDVSDTASVWYNATVLKTYKTVDEESGKEIYEVYVGLV